jgi:hypothetical protein
MIPLRQDDQIHEYKILKINNKTFAKERHLVFTISGKFKTASLSDCYNDYIKSDIDPFWN